MMVNSILLFIPSGFELILVVAVVLLLFGGKKIPELMRGFGKGIKEFNKASEEELEEPEKKVLEK